MPKKGGNKVKKDDKPIQTPDQVDKLIQGIWDGSITPYDLPEDLYNSIADRLLKGLYEGYGGEPADFTGESKELLAELRDNVYMFSGAKTFQQINDISLVVDDEKIKSFADFKAEALKIYDQYNTTYLETEYSTAVGQAQNAVRWNQIESQKETLPYLQYSDVDDSNECDICAPLSGITLPVDDPFWDEYMPLNHFNCRCTVIQIDKYADVELSTAKDIESATNFSDKEMQPMFKMNPGKDGYVFSPEHPYFDVAKKDRAFAKDNFDLKIPPLSDDDET